MRPLSLRLKGFKGIEEGLGLNEIFVDLSNLTGLIGLVGVNGSGKTTFLDNMQPHRLMPSRCDGNYTPGACNFYNEVVGPAEKELIFEMENGEKWRSHLFINPDTTKQEAYLYVEKDGKWVDKNKSGRPTQYDKEIESLLGSPELYFNSIFRCQEAPRLNTYRKGVIKDILADLLLLDNIREKGKSAKAVVDMLSKTIDMLKVQQSMQEPSASRFKDLSVELNEAKNALSVAEQKVQKAESDLVKAAEHLNSLNIEVARFKPTEESRAKTAERVQAIEQHKESSLQKRDVLEKRHKERLDSIEAKRARADKIIANGAEIRNKIEEEKTLAVRRDELEAAIKDLSEAIQAAHDAANNMAPLKDRLNALQVAQAKKKTLHQAKVTALQAEINRIEQSVRILDDLSCSEKQQRECPAVKAVVADKDKLIVSRSEYDVLKGSTGEDMKAAADISELETKIAELQAKADVTAETADRKKLETELSQVKEQLTQVARYTKLLPELSSAEKTLSELDAEAASESKTYDSDINLCESEISAAENELVEVKGVLADLDITLLDLQGVAEKKTAAEAAHAEANESVSTSRGELMEVTGRVAGLTQSVDDSRKASEQLRKTLDKISAIHTKRDLWAVIEKGFSTDGIISLEIDAAGPDISRIANDLLNSSFGSQYSVRINTQDMKADGKMTEAFDIKVMSNDTGQEYSLSSKSGGQKAWLEDSIIKAIALVNVEMSGRRFFTLFTDERDGALSQEVKREYFIMKKRALEKGGFVNEFFISHSESAQDICDHRLTFEKGVGITVE